MTALCLLAASLQAWNLHSLARGRIPHYRLALVYVLYAVVEGWLAWRDPAQIALVAFVALDLWCVGMSVDGIRRAGYEQRGQA